MSEQTIKETMQQALDVLLSFRHTAYNAGKSLNYLAIKNLRQAIKDCEQAEKQEPVARVSTVATNYIIPLEPSCFRLNGGELLYTKEGE